MAEERKEYNNTADATSSAFDRLHQEQLAQLTEAFRNWHRMAQSSYISRVRGRYRLAYLMLRFTGARISEVLRVDDSSHIDYQYSEIEIVSAISEQGRQVLRRIPVPEEITGRILAYLREFPSMQGRVFALDQGNFRREFYRRAEEADLPRELSHPHVLRHTRAIELLEAGVPLTVVQDLLGHALSSTTALYLKRRTEATISRILRERGMI